MGRKNNNKSLVNSQHKLRLSLQDRKIVKDSHSDFNKDLAQWKGQIHDDNLKYIVANAIIHANDVSTLYRTLFLQRFSKKFISFFKFNFFKLHRS